MGSRGYMYVGRGITYPVALEGALKLKEVSYVHAEGYAAGELKHGPISLLDADVPLVAVATRTAVHDKLVSNLMEGRARDARVIAVVTEGDERMRSVADDILWVPATHGDPQPGAGHHPAAALRLPHRGGARHGRRSAAQPGQVGHGRMSDPSLPAPPAGTTELGIDIIRVDRIVKALEKHGRRFPLRILTPAEDAYVRDRPENLAGRWAAKEAVSKVLGLGVRGVGWREIEIVRLPTGQPTVRLHDRALRRAQQLGMERIAVSISHEHEYAVAIAFGVRTRGRHVRLPARCRGPPRRSRAAAHGTPVSPA